MVDPNWPERLLFGMAAAFALGWVPGFVHGWVTRGKLQSASKEGT